MLLAMCIGSGTADFDGGLLEVLRNLDALLEEDDLIDQIELGIPKLEVLHEIVDEVQRHLGPVVIGHLGLTVDHRSFRNAVPQRERHADIAVSTCWMFRRARTSSPRFCTSKVKRLNAST
jgi:gamma-glutamylcysteine synthetase